MGNLSFEIKENNFIFTRDSKKYTYSTKGLRWVEIFYHDDGDYPNIKFGYSNGYFIEEYLPLCSCFNTLKNSDIVSQIKEKCRELGITVYER